MTRVLPEHSSLRLITRPPTRKRYPLLAGPGRRVFHTLLAASGWAVFGYWWWLVFRRVSAAEVRFTFIFLAVATTLIVLLTISWVLHNKRIDRERPARLRIRGPARPASHDSTGRELRLPGLMSKYQRAIRVRVQVEDGAKVYLCEGAVSDTHPPGTHEVAS